MDPIHDLCNLVEATSFDTIPGRITEFAKTLILDTLGVIIGGSSREGVRPVLDLVLEQGGKKESLIPFQGRTRVPASMAAFAMGVMARALDMGSVHEQAIHTAEHTLPVLLAATGLRRGITGKQLITAFVLGEEITVRIGIASNLVQGGMNHLTDGGHYIFGSVAAVGKILELGSNVLCHAEGIASTMTQPHSNAIYFPPTLMQRVHHGFIAQDAINCCLLARGGITGPTEQVLTGPCGYLSLLIHWDTTDAAITEGLGEEWRMAETTLKPFASCKRTHAAATGVLDQMQRHEIAPASIRSIEIDLPPSDYAIVASPQVEKWNPGTETECQFSLPFVVATAVHDQEVLIDAFAADARERRQIRDLMPKIHARDDKSLPPWSARVSTTTDQGRFDGEYLHVKGHPENPFSREELIQKFKICTRYASNKMKSSTIDRLVEAVLHLDEVDDVEKEILKHIR